MTPRRPKSSGPPKNPHVLHLVEGKRKWCSALTVAGLKDGFRGWHERGYLPHRDEPGLVQFVTYGLADCFPRALMSEWQDLLQIEEDAERQAQLQDYLDRGRGECYLRDVRIASLVESSLLRFHEEKYELRSWVIMQNHIHVLFEVLDVPMSVVISKWKSYSAHEANKILAREGAFWHEDYWDTFMRDLEHEIAVRNYVENNPVKAGLVKEAKDWPWSSARFRDANQGLRLGRRSGKRSGREQ